jgi:hypothetical protein
MEKHILRWSYWGGLICVLMAIVTRILNVLGVSTMLVQTRGNPVSFRTFVNGALLFLLTSIATSGFIWSKRQNN